MNSGKKIASLLAGGALTIAAVPLAGTALASEAVPDGQSGTNVPAADAGAESHVARALGARAGHPARPGRLRVEPGRHQPTTPPSPRTSTKAPPTCAGPREARRGPALRPRRANARRHRLHRSDRRRGERVHGLGGRFQAEGPHAQDHGLHLLRQPYRRAGQRERRRRGLPAFGPGQRGGSRRRREHHHVHLARRLSGGAAFAVRHAALQPRW